MIYHDEQSSSLSWGTVDESQCNFSGTVPTTEERKVCVAAQTCFLLLHCETDYYPSSSSAFVLDATQAKSQDWRVS